jgi:restriction system protein
VSEHGAQGWLERTGGANAVGGGCLVFIGMFIVALILGADSSPALVIGVIAAGAFIALAGPGMARAAEERRQKFRAEIGKIVEPHLPALLRRYRQLSRTDDYGVRDDSKWQIEVNRFCDNIIFPAIGVRPDLVPKATKANPRSWPHDLLVFELVETAAIKATGEFAVQFNPNMSPIDYEHFCAERLKLSGWEPRVTQASGDQGADIVATKGKATLVVQCKHYRAPVGNKAVQEIAAAVRHYSADAGIVVATNGFTKSAEQLASTNGVLIISHDDLTSQWRHY